MAALDPTMRVPDIVGEVTAWRAWELVGTVKLPRLMSVTANVAAYGPDAIWPTGRWFHAICKKGHAAGEIPSEGCTCGLYAARDRDHLIGLGYGAYSNTVRKVIGEIAYAGKVIPGTQGFRGERARIKRLIVPYELVKFAVPLSEAYHVPVTTGFLFAPSTKGLQ